MVHQNETSTVGAAPNPFVSFSPVVLSVRGRQVDLAIFF